MCQTIYISSIGHDVLHERFCVNDGHPAHSEEFVNNEWRSKD